MNKLRLALLSTLWIVLVFASRSPASEYEAFFASRQVMATVYFAQGSVLLDTQGEAQIVAVVPRLRNLDPAKKLVRVEGFSAASENGGDGVTKAMLRAHAVTDGLHARGAGTERYTLNGQVISAKGRQGASPDRVEIVVYDNLLDIHPVEIDRIIER